MLLLKNILMFRTIFQPDDSNSVCLYKKKEHMTAEANQVIFKFDELYDL